MSIAQFDTWKSSDGTDEYYKCRAWVNFNGTGTVAIRASGNVSSITDNGTGDYTVNFTNAMPDADYAVAGTTSSPAVTTERVMFTDESGVLTSSVGVFTANGSGVAVDHIYNCVAIFR